MYVSMGCLPITTLYFTDSTSFLFRLVLASINRQALIVNAHIVFVSISHSLTEIDLEIKDPDLLVVPSICLGQPVEETPEGTVNSFLNEFM